MPSRTSPSLHASAPRHSSSSRLTARRQREQPADEGHPPILHCATGPRRPIRQRLRDERPPWLIRRSFAPFMAGIIAALAGTAAGHLVASLLVPASSPVLAVGTAVINLTPTPLKVWAVRERSADKPVLIGSVLAGRCFLPASPGSSPAAGSRSARPCSSSWWPPRVRAPWSSRPPVRWTRCLRWSPRWSASRSSPTSSAVAAHPPGPARDAATSRRGFLIGAGAVAGVAIVLARHGSVDHPHAQQDLGHRAAQGGEAAPGARSRPRGEVRRHQRRSSLLAGTSTGWTPT